MCFLVYRGSKTSLAGATLLISVVTALSWYLFVAGGVTVVTFANFLSYVGQGLATDFFNPASRPPIVLQALGITPLAQGFLHDVNRAIQYLVLFSLVAGLLVFVRKKNKSETERVFLPFITGAVLILAASVVVPYFAGGLNMSRFYHISLIFASPCLVCGIQGIVSGISSICRARISASNHLSYKFTISSKGWISAASVLILYSLFSSGWVWAVTMDRPESPILDRERMLNSSDLSTKLSYFNRYTIPQDIAGALWLKASIPNDRLSCADYSSRFHVLNSYGGFPRTDPTTLSGRTPDSGSGPPASLLPWPGCR